jgi:hypothetical protein
MGTMTQTPQEIALEAVQAMLFCHSQFKGDAYTAELLAKDMVHTYHAKLLELGAAKNAELTEIGDTPTLWEARSWYVRYNPCIIIKTDSNKP